MKKLLMCSVFYVMCFFVHAANYTPQTVINPKTWGNDSYVSNADNILTPVAVDNINQMCQFLYDETKVELAVVAIDSYDESLYDDYNFAVNLFNYWGIGDKKANNGILVLLVTEQQVIRIATGGEIDKILTDDICGDIINNNLSYFPMFSEGMTHIVSDILRFCTRDDIKKELINRYSPNYTLWLIIAAALALIVIIFTIIRSRKK